MQPTATDHTSAAAPGALRARSASADPVKIGATTTTFDRAVTRSSSGVRSSFRADSSSTAAWSAAA
jgi:hypothetical protein